MNSARVILLALQSLYGVMLGEPSGILPFSHAGQVPQEGAKPPAVDGFAYRGVNAQGLHEYLHDKAGMEFVYIPGGTFLMGSPESEEGRGTNEAQYRVTLSSFLIAKYEVTQDVWERVMGENPSYFPKGGRYPVETVSWDDATEFCDKLGLELPTEAEWEYACRAGTTTAHTGPPEDLGWHRPESLPETHPVGLKSPNAYGLYDMHGNVWEWCRDVYSDESPSAPQTDPIVTEGGFKRVIRGGSFLYLSESSRSAYRVAVVPTFTNGDLGFRPSKSLRDSSALRSVRVAVERPRKPPLDDPKAREERRVKYEEQLARNAPLPAIEHSASCPVVCATCYAAQEKALGYLTKHIFVKREMRGASGQVVAGEDMTFALAGWVFQLAREPERYAEHLEQVRARLDAAPRIHFERSWMCGFLALPLAESAARGTVETESLERVVQILEAEQNIEGGWGHGGRVPEFGTYSATLIVTTNWCAAALGLCRKAGVAVNPDVLNRVLQLFQSVQAESGAMPYGGPTCLKGYEAARTTGTMVALAALGQIDSATFSKARRYVRANIREIPAGHADPHQHLLSGAMAALLDSEGGWLRYRDLWVNELVEHQKEDGAFPCIVGSSVICFWGEFLDFSMPGLHELYATATGACILGLGRSRVLDRLRGMRERIWSRQIGDLTHVALDADRIYVVPAEGVDCICLDTQTGKELWKARLFDVDDESVSLGANNVWADDRHVIVELINALHDPIWPDHEGRMKYPGNLTRLVCLSAGSGARLWERWLTSYLGGHSAVGLMSDRAMILTANGALDVVETTSGETLYTRSLPEGGSPSMGLPPTICVRTESKLQVLNGETGSSWEAEAPRVGAWAEFSVPAVFEDRVVCGASDGTLFCWILSDGTELWRRTFTSGVESCVPVTRDEPHVIVATEDVRVYCLDASDGRELWSFAPPAAKEVHSRAILLVRSTPGSVWVHPLGNETLYQLRPADGSVIAAIPLTRADSRAFQPYPRKTEADLFKSRPETVSLFMNGHYLVLREGPTLSALRLAANE
ncbi:MAG: SUMF1/EgtB/PvdO family nonheme iron enzyme [Planctomycetota bacterium]